MISFRAIPLKEWIAEIRRHRLPFDWAEMIGVLIFLGLAIFLVWSLFADVAYSYTYYARFLHNGR